MVESVGQVGVDEWLRLKVCPGCEYSLETLQVEGVCPECGRGYGREWVVLVGEGRGKFEGQEGGGRKGLVAQGVSLAIFLWLMIEGHWWGGRETMVAYMGIMGLMLGLGVYARLFSAREPRMQLWVSEEGVGQVLSTPEGRRAMRLRKRVGAMILPAYLLLLPAGLVGRWRVWLDGLVGVWVLGQVGLWWLEKRSGGEGEEYRPALWRWGDVDGVRMEETSKGRMRVRCRGVTRWGWVVISRGWVIDFEVECPKELVAGVGEKIRGWWIAKQRRG